MRPLRAFWWSPRRSPALLVREARANPRVWVAMALRTGRPFVNFGDELTPLALAMASGRRVTWAPPRKAEVIAAGSILDLYADHSGHGGATVWGAGLRSVPRSAARAEFITSRLGPVLAVRGPLTREALELPAAIPMADPGVLAGQLVSRPARRRGTGLLPHFRTWATREGRECIGRAEAAGQRVIVPSDSVPDVLEQVASLDFLYTSSLHGLIGAHALGVPVQWVDIPGIAGWEEPSAKFRDYLASVGSDMEVMALGDALSGRDRSAPVRRDEAGRLREVSAELATHLLESWV